MRWCWGPGPLGQAAQGVRCDGSATTQGTSQALPPLVYGPRGRPTEEAGSRAGPTPKPGAHWAGGFEGRNDARTGMAAGIPAAARCVQRFDGSLNSAIHTTYRISLRSSSMPEPRDPLPKVFTRYDFSFRGERRAFSAFGWPVQRRGGPLGGRYPPRQRQ